MASLAQLDDPHAYHACDWDLLADAAGRDTWVRHFLEHLNPLIEHIRESYPNVAAARIAAFADAYRRGFLQVAEYPERFERIDIYTLDMLRARVQREFRFDDPYAAMKKRDTEAALRLWPDLLDEIDTAASDTQLELLAAGLLAGNLADAGALVAMDRLIAAGSDFGKLREHLPPRPWWIDHAGRWFAAATGPGPRRRVAWFVDNSGCDICLGVLPMVRWMLVVGWEVALVANDRPALNDITAAELATLLGRMAQQEAVLGAALAARRLRVINSGQTCPLIDLTSLSPECVAATADCRLVWLHGMGRAVESNWTARFTCDVVRTAVLKDPAIAAHMGGGLFDCIFRCDHFDG